MDLFYVKNISENELSFNESKHCLLSLRKKINDKILITEGKGIVYRAVISGTKNKKVNYNSVIPFNENVRKIKSHIVIAPTKNKARFEWFLEKVTEIGVDLISPIICDNSERKKINYLRCEKVLISAMKQSKNATLPKLNSPVEFKKIIQNFSKNTYIAHCYNEPKNSFKEILNKIKNPKEITLFIGPEGDFSEKELNFAKEAGIIPVGLGENRLRTETAGIIGCSLINLLT